MCCYDWSRRSRTRAHPDKRMREGYDEAFARYTRAAMSPPWMSGRWRWRKPKRMRSVRKTSVAGALYTI